ncbi:hypothetical protein PAE2110 [Pyrobaculum aerophilum str. IM2]|uniref:Uncharacterized protein n=1 Tax=Pyrobaculum aerophilum (strain ATCC 51768 / DSM 7523 / JCM 9630 / CIP 104966 / NBRC 100827 / IM2) TaxID=178306 RepID=Q8ZVV1_PYRAE|nr:hypothetical protein PAE2110 [Pyrobaculum aerophilum str. IM2]
MEEALKCIAVVEKVVKTAVMAAGTAQGRRLEVVEATC